MCISICPTSSSARAPVRCCKPCADTSQSYVCIFVYALPLPAPEHLCSAESLVLTPAKVLRAFRSALPLSAPKHLYAAASHVQGGHCWMRGVLHTRGPIDTDQTVDKNGGRVMMSFSFRNCMCAGQGGHCWLHGVWQTRG